MDELAQGRNQMQILVLAVFKFKVTLPQWWAVKNKH
jgi:hypothetical protein